MMATNTFFDEDYQLCEENQLGTPLHIYRLKPGSIRFLRITGSIIFTIGIISLVVLLIPLPHRDFTTFLPALIGSLYALFNGGVFYGIMARRARSMRVIVCEHGLLQVRKMIRRNAVEVVYWKDIRSIHKMFLEGYSISYRTEKRWPSASLTIANDYQNSEELIALITERHQEFAGLEEERIDARPVVTKPQGDIRYRCRCCRYKTLNERGAYEICAVCFWEDDGQDDADANIDRLVGPNHMSPTLGRENYLKFGAIHKQALPLVRPPLPEER